MQKIVCPFCDHQPFRTPRGLSWHLSHIHGIVSEDMDSTAALELQRDFALRAQLIEYQVEFLHYMSPIDNLESILSLGILSHNRAMSVDHVDLSLTSVQSRRVQVIQGTENTIHDYVPLYFAIHTPMQYMWTRGTERINSCLSQEDLVFIDVDAFPILRTNGVLYTDGNAASEGTDFYELPADLNILDWDIIMETDSWSAEHKRKKAAEVLVPDIIPVGCFSRIVVYNKKAARRLRRNKGVSSSKMQIKVRPEYYY